MNKTEDLRNQNVGELKALHRDENRNLFDLVNMVRSTKKSEKPHLIGAKKKEIARILTVLREKELTQVG
ncbi:MAG: 50S ribosomal protein L29 [Chlamydiales bacterium]|nr:50S ribosomal protein L29 [Chlamydiales bacterium]